MKSDDELKAILFESILVNGVDMMEQPMRDYFQVGEEVDTNEEWDRLYDIRKRMIVRADRDAYTIHVEFGPHDAETEALLDAAEAADNEIRARLGIEERRK